MGPKRQPPPRTRPAGITTYAWDSENRLLQAARPTQTWDHTYAADGKRRRRSDGVTAIYTVWDRETVLLEAGGSLQEVARCTENPAYWGGLVSRRSGGESRFYLVDQQQSVRELLSSSAASVGSATYTAFGVPVAQSGLGTPRGIGGGAGYQEDQADLLYVRDRYLAPQTGRWISRDPIREAAVAYLYVRNEALRRIDPTGELSTKHCSPGLQASLKHACQNIHSNLPNFINSVLACVKKASGDAARYGVDCKVDAMQLRCLAAVCTGATVSCLPNAPCGHCQANGLCGVRDPQPGVFGCNIVLCVDNISQPGMPARLWS